MANIEGPCRDKELIYALIRFTDPPINNTIEYRAKLLKKFRGTMGIVETQCSDNNFDNILYELIENKKSYRVSRRAPTYYTAYAAY